MQPSLQNASLIKVLLIRYLFRLSLVVVVTDDGMTAVYTDLERKALGLVDITDPKYPVPVGIINLPGEPSSVVIKESFALTVVSLDTSFTDPKGKLCVIDIDKMSIVKEIELDGQPDSIAISPDKKYAVIAIENERDEDLENGQIPQIPAGFVVIIDIEENDPADWPAPFVVDITGLGGVFEASDPEPEYVSINEENIVVVTLQENNAAVLINVTSQEVVTSFSMGSVDLNNIDTKDDGLISQTESLSNVPREPDGVVSRLNPNIFYIYYFHLIVKTTTTKCIFF